MNKADLVSEIQSSLGDDSSKSTAERALDAVLDGIKKSLVSGESVQIIGFGTFSISDRAARMGVNPKTGEKMHIAASKAVKFKAGSALKSSVQ